LITIAYSAVATFVVLKVVGALVLLRADRLDEGLGLDVSQHGEEAYAEGEGAILILHDGDTETPALAPSATLGGES